MIAVVDYATGNLRSVADALRGVIDDGYHRTPLLLGTV